MGFNEAKTKARAVKALRTLLNAAQDLTEAEKILLESSTKQASQKPTRTIIQGESDAR